MYKRDSFCGPAGNGKVSVIISLLMSWALRTFNIKIEKSCKNHDINWNDGPQTQDDIRFAADVYEELTEQDRHPFLAGIVCFIGFILVRLTAIAYKKNNI
jgi:hypothetical protein